MHAVRAATTTDHEESARRAEGAGAFTVACEVVAAVPLPLLPLSPLPLNPCPPVVAVAAAAVNASVGCDSSLPPSVRSASGARDGAS